MRNFAFILLLLIIVSCNDQTLKNSNDYVVKMTPLGISDVPRDTLLIGEIGTKFPKDNFYRRYMLTDDKTLENLVYFIRKNDHFKYLKKEDFSGYGCYKLSVFKQGLLITQYRINRTDGVEYLNSVIYILNKNNADPKVIKKIKEELNYIK